MSDKDTGQDRTAHTAAKCGVSADDAVEVRALRRDLRRLDDIIGELAGLLAETIPRVDTIEEHVARLRGQVRALLDVPAATASAEKSAVAAVKAELGLLPDPPGPWCWAVLDAEQAQKAWRALTRWVAAVLVPTYAITRAELVDCWPRHPEIVAELSWLRHAYLEAHQPGAHSVEAMSWHLRCRPGALAAIRDAVRGVESGRRQEPRCGPGHHLTPAGDRAITGYTEAQQGLAGIEHWKTAWQEAMAADLAGRRPAPSD